MGDSLTDKRHWANREQLWAEELVAQLKKTYHGEVTLVNPAIGGTTLSQNVILMPRWLQEAPSPDLVLIWFGGNDWDTGVRGERYRQYLEMAIDRVRRATKGQAEVLVMTTCPGFAAWETRNELCRAAFEAARERKTGFVDAAAAFHKAGSREEALKRQYWAWDNVHLGPGGHALIADTVFQAIASGGAGDLTASAGASWMKSASPGPPAGGETPLSSFEPGQEDLVDHGAGQVVKEHASDGEYSLRLVSKEKDYPGFSLQDGRPAAAARELAGPGRCLQSAGQGRRRATARPRPASHELQPAVQRLRDREAGHEHHRHRLHETAPLRHAEERQTGVSQCPAAHALRLLPGPGREQQAADVVLRQRAAGPPGDGPDRVAAGHARRAPAEAGAARPRPGRAASNCFPASSPAGRTWSRATARSSPSTPPTASTPSTSSPTAKSYVGLRIIDGQALRKFKDYVLLKVDVFNPQDEPVHCSARIDDAASKDYGSRYNDDGVVMPPGKSTFEINLTGLTKSNARNFADRKKVDLATVRLMTLCIAPGGQAADAFLRQRAAGRLGPAGGRRAEGVRASARRARPSTRASRAARSRFPTATIAATAGSAADYATIAYMPDALTGNCASGREFRLKLPNGRYEVNLCWDMFGLWGTLPTFHWRKLLVNGQEVLNEQRSGAEFLANQYYAHEDDEDLPGQDLWEKYIASYQKIHRFAATVTDGLLRIEPQADAPGRGSASWWSIPRTSWPRAGISWIRSTPAARRSSTPRWWSVCRRPAANSPSPARKNAPAGSSPSSCIRKTTWR